MTSGAETYGAAFLAALDKQIGYRAFRPAERAAILKMDRAGVVRRMRSYNYQWCQAAKNGSPEDLATVLSDCLESTRAAVTNANTDLEACCGLSILLILACM